MNTQHGGVSNQTRVVEEFNAEEFGAPFKVILKDCVRVTVDPDTEEVLSYNIPDPGGLLRHIVLARILHERKLNGAEVKFLRKAVGLKQKLLAQKIEVVPEHMSRIESGAVPIAAGSEKLLRLFLFKTVIKHHKFKECEAKRKLEDALDALFDIIKPVAAYDSEDDLVFCFCRRSRPIDAGNDNPDDEEDGWNDGTQAVAA